VRRRIWWAILAIALVGSGSAAASSQVVLPRGQPVRVALAVPLSGPLVGFGASFVNAARMAVELHPNVRGFPVELDPFDADCFTTDAAVAAAIVADSQILGVIGHACSFGFATALPIYEAAAVVTISGSATADSLPPLGPTVFNRTAVSDGDGFADWYPRVSTLPRGLLHDRARSGDRQPHQRPGRARPLREASRLARSAHRKAWAGSRRSTCVSARGASRSGMRAMRASGAGVASSGGAPTKATHRPRFLRRRPCVCRGLFSYGGGGNRT